MKKHFTWAVLFSLALSFVNGQALKTTDTIQTRRGTTAYFIDGFKVYANLTTSDSLKILKETAAKLNGHWKSNNSSDIVKFIISAKSLSGQMLLPFENVQQTPPIPIKLTFNKIGTISLTQIMH